MKNILDYVSLSFKSEPEKLHPEAYIIRDFINKKEMQDLQENLYKMHPDETGTIPFIYLDRYRQRLIDLFNENIYIEEMKNVVVHNEGGMDLHHDIISYELADMLVPESYPDKEKIKMPAYTFLIYLNDNYEGGEISYPEYNVDHKPTAGDLVIHTTEVIHGVRQLKFGFRYRYQGIIFADTYVDADKFDISMIPDYNDTRSYSYNIDGKNERLAKFKESYIEQGLYKGIYEKE